MYKHKEKKTFLLKDKIQYNALSKDAYLVILNK